MKRIILLILLFNTALCSAQTLQLHYDARHAFAPKRYGSNFGTIYFEYFKTLDTGKAIIKPGNFLLKLQADLNGDKNNIGKYYMQVSQEVRFWKPKVFLNLQYNGGLGVTEPKQYSYYIFNSYQAGLSYHYNIGSAYLTSVLNYRYTSFAKPSHDAMYTMYFYKGLFNYKAELTGDFSVWTENKDHGDDYTAGQTGKRVFFFAEPQIWYRLTGAFAIGVKLNAYYHVNNSDDVFEVLPTAGLRCKL